MTSVFPLLSRHLAARPRGGRAHAACDRTARSSTLGVPLAAGGLVIAPELARLVGGDEFAAAADPLRLLLCAAALAYLSGLFGYALIAGDRSARRCGSRSPRWWSTSALNVALAPALRRDRRRRDRARLARRCCWPAAGCWSAAGSGCGRLRSGRCRRDRRRRRDGRRRVAAARAHAGVTVPLGALVYGLVLWARGGIDRRTLEALRR